MQFLRCFLECFSPFFPISHFPLPSAAAAWFVFLSFLPHFEVTSCNFVDILNSSLSTFHRTHKSKRVFGLSRLSSSLSLTMLIIPCTSSCPTGTHSCPAIPNRPQTHRHTHTLISQTCNSFFALVSIPFLVTH